MARKKMLMDVIFCDFCKKVDLNCSQRSMAYESNRKHYDLCPVCIEHFDAEFLQLEVEPEPEAKPRRRRTAEEATASPSARNLVQV